MSTMEQHPKAQSSVLRFTIDHRITAAIVQIASDVLAVFISLGVQTRLMFWNWQAGQLLSVCIMIIIMCYYVLDILTRQLGF